MNARPAPRDARGRRDAKYITVCDRAKDMVLTGSENVFAMEVERCVLSHPAVELCAVYGVPDELLGEAVKCVALAPDAAAKPDAAALRAWCADRLAEYTVPREVELVRAPAELPMTGSGKVAKAARRRAGQDAERQARARQGEKLSKSPPAPSSAERNGGARLPARAYLQD